MAIDIVIPAVGESVTSGVVAGWRKKDGERVERDEVVMDFETDKITMEITAPAAGVLHPSAKEGDQVPIGGVVGKVDEAAAARQAAPAPEKSPAKGLPEPKPADPLRTLPTAESAPEDPGVRATPLARKLAQEMGVDLSKVEGSGAGKRVREQDVVAFAKGSKPSPAAPQAPARPQVQVSGPPRASGTPSPHQGVRGVTRERMSPLRQRVAARLVEAQHTAAMLTTFNECDMSGVMALRARYKDGFEKKHGVGLGFMSFFVRAVVSALRAFPMVNASIVRDENDQPAIEKHDFCDIAIAVASPKGLVVPVIRGCEALSMAQIELAVKDVGARAREGRLTLEEMQGGTFTITNGGVFGSLMSTPILNPPQSAILGMHTIKNRAVEDPANPGHAAIRPMMYLALSYDHRLIDGAEAVRFLVRVKECIESPERLLLDA
ncbi:MAG: 2-oxoglutarate dehydrogenase complex dihydrolipoyllysine-residue succinyltransferase [Phycisphaerales bacterium]|nr:2-oxoglutarate dehydrogenase complex dihydrolipoyllysine-residue succinyltransferase [Phycisphaerales bacterium]